jgi:hypothetical protein
MVGQNIEAAVNITLVNCVESLLSFGFAALRFGLEKSSIFLIEASDVWGHGAIPPVVFCFPDFSPAPC